MLQMRDMADDVSGIFDQKCMQASRCRCYASSLTLEELHANSRGHNRLKTILIHLISVETNLRWLEGKVPTSFVSSREFHS